MSEEQSQSWRPMIGMTRSNQRGRIDTSGHRTLSYVYIFVKVLIYIKMYIYYIVFYFFRHYVPRNSSNFNSVPPPQSKY